MTGMHIGLDLSFTHTEGLWARAGSWERPFPDVRMFQDVARTAEAAGVDLLFFGDGAGIPDTWRGSIAPAVEWGIQWPRHDMSPIITAMALATERIGFGLTYSSTFLHPFYVARLLNSLNHVTAGRIAFNVVASSRLADAANYGYAELPAHEERYARMDEFMAVCFALWDSVPREAIVMDRATGRFADPALVHPIDHHGAYFDVKGPLSAMPSPQGRPVVVQAGNSPRGIRTSASFADLVFGFGGPLSAQQRHRRMLDEALVAEGRDPAAVGILWGTQLIVGATAAEAEERRREVLAFWDDEAVGAFLSHNAGFDFSSVFGGRGGADAAGADTVILGELAERMRASGATQSGLVGALVDRYGVDHALTRAEFFEHGWAAATGLDHTLTGDPESLADQLEEVFAQTGSRGGFMFSSPLGMPAGVAGICELLIPVLRARGALAPRYPGATLRENLLG